MSENTLCTQCSSPFANPTGVLMICPECGNEWNLAEITEAEETGLVVKDANGNLLQDEDSVVVVKDLPVKGAPKPIKAGTNVKSLFFFVIKMQLWCHFPFLIFRGIKRSIDSP